MDSEVKVCEVPLIISPCVPQGLHFPHILSMSDYAQRPCVRERRQGKTKLLHSEPRNACASEEEPSTRVMEDLARHRSLILGLSGERYSRSEKLSHREETASHAPLYCVGREKSSSSGARPLWCLGLKHTLLSPILSSHYPLQWSLK